MKDLIMKRGAFVVLEGCDKVGKTTQAKLLKRSLEEMSIPAVIRRFPDRTTEIGKLIDQYLNNKNDLAPETMHLLFSANRWELKKDLMEILESGTTLIVDRYVASGAAFSQVYTGQSVEWCKAPDAGLPCPDQTFLLEVAQDNMRLRLNFGEEKFENREMQQKVAKNFRAMVDPKSWKIVNADRNVEEIHAEILSSTLTILRQINENPEVTVIHDNWFK